MSGARSANPAPEKKQSRWRFGRRRSSSSKVEVNGSPRSPGMSPPVQSQFHRSQSLTPMTSPTSQMSPTSTSPMSRVPMRDREEPDEGLRQLVKSLSLKDDPSKFGAGTLAARRMQREELDAAMAQNLFSRELARVPQISSEPAPPQNMPPGHVRPQVQVDMRPLMHLKSAFTEREWALFQEDPLRYIHTHGLPQEVQLVDVTATTTTDTVIAPQQPQQQPQQQQQQQQQRQPQRQQQGVPSPPEPSPHFILPPEFPRPPPLTDPPSDPFPSTPTQQPQPPSKGLSADEIGRLLTTFGHQKTVGRADGKNRPSRIRGRKLPKGAKTKGIISEEDANECSICLLEFEPGEKVGLLPCCHRFHAECVVSWLQRDATCPECREGLRGHLH